MVKQKASFTGRSGRNDRVRGALLMLSFTPALRIVCGLSIMIASAAFTNTGVSAGTLDAVKQRDRVICGVDGDLLGFSKPDPSNGEMTGLDADTCYAVAAAVLGDRDKVEFLPLNPDERFDALHSSRIDVLARNTTHTLRREAALGVSFTYYNFIDSQSFIVKTSIGVDRAIELNGTRICVQDSTTTKENLVDFFLENGIKYTPVLYTTTRQTREGFERGECNVLTADRSQLAAMRKEMAEPDEAEILPDEISKEPLGPVVREGDDQWANIVKWVVYALINADEMDISSSNVDEIKASDKPNIRRLLGLEDDLGIHLGLTSDWAYRIIKQVGNYDEIYRRNIADKLNLPRAGSLNALWTDGGILYAPPIR